MIEQEILTELRAIRQLLEKQQTPSLLPMEKKLRSKQLAAMDTKEANKLMLAEARKRGKR